MQEKEIIDAKAIDNVIEKLQVYMNRKDQTMHGLAHSMGFAYQPFYRLMTKKNLPTISSLDSIAQNLGCTISELTSSEVFLDVPCYDSIESYLENKTTNTVRVYLPYEMLQSFLKEELIVLKTSLISKQLDFDLNNINYFANTNVYQLFTVSKKLSLDGFYLVKYQNKMQILETLSVSSKMITAKIKGATVQVPFAELEIFAKFISYVELPNHRQQVVYGKLDS